MQAAISTKERENIARIENVKSQAIFAVSLFPPANTVSEKVSSCQTHAAFNSTSKGKASSRATNRPVTPTKSQNSSPGKRDGKSGTPGQNIGKPAKTDRPSFAQPMFGKLSNGFATSVRVKRAMPDVKRDLEDGEGDETSSSWRDDLGGDHGTHLGNLEHSHTHEVEPSAIQESSVSLFLVSVRQH